MNFEQILYIVEVAKHRSLSVAAQNLHVTQSGISQSITSLEKELGLKIFYRSRGQGAVPTDEGKIILKQAYEILRKLGEIKETASSFQLTKTGELKVSSSPGLTSFLVKAMSPFSHEFQNVHMEYVEKNVSAVLEDIRQHKTDIGLITYSSDWNINLEGVSFEVLFEGKQKVYVSKHSSLANLSSVTPQDLLDQTLVTYKGEFMHYFIKEFFNKYQPLRILFSSNNIEGVLQAIIEHSAITFSPDFIMKNYRPVIKGDLIPIELVNHQPVNFSIGLVLPEDKYLSTLSKKYIDYLISETINC